MNKKITAIALAIPLLFINISASKAEDTPATLAIIDTAINSNSASFGKNIVYEACVLSWNSCPNGKSFQEGPGSANMPLNQMMTNGFEHGTQMVTTAVSTNPNVKIVFIRFVGATSTGTRQITNEDSFVNALKWAYLNKDRFNIKAIAMSQSANIIGTGTNYCPSTPATSSIISNLVSSGVQVFLPAGNSRDMTKVLWPACIQSAFTVSASAYGDGPAIYTNYDPLVTDIFARGDIASIMPNGLNVNITGTSVSNQVAASSYIALANKYPTYSITQLTDLFKTKSINLVSRTVKGKIVDVKAVLNG